MNSRIPDKASIRRTMHEALRTKGQSAYPGNGTIIPNTALNYLIDGPTHGDLIEFSADSPVYYAERDQSQIAIVCSVVERVCGQDMPKEMRERLEQVRSCLSHWIIERYKDA